MSESDLGISGIAGNLVLFGGISFVPNQTLLFQIEELVKENKMLKNRVHELSMPKSRFHVNSIRYALFNKKRGKGYLRRAIKRKFRRRRNKV